MLSEDAVRRYHDDGFLFPFRAFSPETAAAYRADVERTCDKAAGPDAAISGAVSYRVKPYLLFTWAANLVREPTILDAVEDLIGPDILVFHTTMWWKTKRSPNRVPWHQDGTYFGLAPHEHVTAWVALSPSNTQTGCVRVVPGSHRNGPDPACRSSRPRPDAVARPDRGCRRRPVTRGADGAVAGRVLAAPHAGDPRLRPEHRRRRPDRYRHQLYSDPGPPYRPDPAVGDPWCAATTATIISISKLGRPPTCIPTQSPPTATATRDFWTASKSIPEMAGIH